MTKPHTPTAGEKYAAECFIVGCSAYKQFSNYIDAAIAEAQKPTKASLEECVDAARLSGDGVLTELHHVDIVSACKAVIESLIKQGVKLYVE